MKVKTMKVQVGKGDEDVAEMFNQMLGAGSLNISIAYPKYIKMRHLSMELVKLFTMVANSPFMKKFGEFKQQKDELERFVIESNRALRDLFAVDLAPHELDLAALDEGVKKSFADAYEAVKKSHFVKQFIIMCDKLVPYKNNFNDLRNMNPKFITCMISPEFCPFPFTTLNLKHVFSLPAVRGQTVEFFMTVLSKAFEFSYELYKVISSPDVDVDQFTEVIMSNLAEIQKHPKLNRCGDAFGKIKESVELLKDNFSGYYRDFVATKDSTIMMQNFVADVAKKQNANPSVTRQFRVIISYYREIAKQQIQNPKVKLLFDKVNESFAQLERGTQNLNVAGRENEEAPPADDNGEETAAPDLLLDEAESAVAMSAEDMQHERSEEQPGGSQAVQPMTKRK